jgi:cephalosporin hydroxylase
MHQTAAVAAVRRATSSPGKSKGRGATKAKAKGKPARLPSEIKHRGSNGCKVIVQTASKHTLADVVAALQAFADHLRAGMEASAQDAA